MLNYVGRRVLLAIPLLIGISIIIFLLLQMTPGGPLAVGEGRAAGGRATAEQLERLRNRYGLDQPLYLQYAAWAGGLASGDWGTSFNTGQPVLQMLAERIPVTLLLTGSALLISVAVAVPLGVLAAVRRNTIVDYLATGVSMAGVGIPSFWFGLMLLLVFSFTLNLLPSSGLVDPKRDLEGLEAAVDVAAHLVLPVSVLALIGTGILTRYVRAAVIEVLSQDYIRTARAKGLPEWTILTRHALKNAAAPIVTVVMLQIPELFLGAVITESVFAIPGMGRLFVESANLRDYPVLLGILTIAAVLVVLANLLADLSYAILDPRVKLG